MNSRIETRQGMTRIRYGHPLFLNICKMTIKTKRLVENTAQSCINKLRITGMYNMMHKIWTLFELKY